MEALLVRVATSDFDKRPCDQLYPLLWRSYEYLHC